MFDSVEPTYFLPLDADLVYVADVVWAVDGVYALVWVGCGVDAVTVGVDAASDVVLVLVVVEDFPSLDVDISSVSLTNVVASLIPELLTAFVVSAAG